MNRPRRMSRRGRGGTHRTHHCSGRPGLGEFLVCVVWWQCCAQILGAHAVITDDRELVSAIRARIAERVVPTDTRSGSAPRRNSPCAAKRWWSACQACSIRIGCGQIFAKIWKPARSRRVGAPWRSNFGSSSKPRLRTIAARRKAGSTSPANGRICAAVRMGNSKPLLQDNGQAGSAGGLKSQTSATVDAAPRRRLNSLRRSSWAIRIAWRTKPRKWRSRSRADTRRCWCMAPPAPARRICSKAFMPRFAKSRPRQRPFTYRPRSSQASSCMPCTRAACPVFASKFRDLELLVIDDLQFLAGKKATIGELQHTIDVLLRGGKQLVFAADQPPAALQGARAGTHFAACPAAWCAGSKPPSTPRGWELFAIRRSNSA